MNEAKFFRNEKISRSRAGNSRVVRMPDDGAALQVNDVFADVRGDVADALQVFRNRHARKVVFRVFGIFGDAFLDEVDVFAVKLVDVVVAVDDRSGGGGIAVSESVERVLEHARGGGRHLRKVDALFRGNAGFGDGARALGDVDRHVGDALDFHVDFQHGDDRAQVRGDGLVKRENLQTFLFDADFLAVDGVVVLRDFVREGDVERRNGAKRAAQRGFRRRGLLGEVVLIDIKEGLSEGKMLDMYQTSTLMDFDTKLVGTTNDYKKTANSDVVVITSGIPRKPGMTREELIGTNANIMKGVIANVIKYSPRAIIIVVANPMDTLTYLALKASGLPKNRVIGMGGALDSSRFKCYLAKATGANINNVDGMVIGGHGDTTMIPLLSKATVNGVPVTQFASKKKLQEAVQSTMVGGATLTKLIGTSAWYAPGAAASMMVEAILHDQKKLIPCSCYLEGEYGESDICIGVPAIIGRKGVEKIVKVDLTKEESEKFAASAAAVRKTNNVLHEINAL